VESIANSLNGNNILLSQMQSNSALNKITADKAAESQEGVGNALQSFGDVLKQQMNDINTLQSQADQAVQTYATGGDIELHNVILATEKADMALQLALQVRNRVVGAYQEITRMNI
jgi:flagellar hook-basal body complex protein FliE